MNTLTRQTFATVTTPSARGDEPSMLISTIALDRDSDVIVPEGGDFKAYLRNPVVGFQHFRTDPLPIGSTVRLDVEPGKGIRATWRWLENDPLASRVRNAFQQGVLRAASVGFIPLEWLDIRESGGRRYTKWELAEWSLVGIPSNREAVRTLRGLDLWPADDEPVLEIIDADDGEIDEDVLRTALRELAAEARMKNSARLAGLLGEPTFEIDPHVLAHAIGDVVRAGLRQATEDAVRAELRRLRGRLD